MIVELDYDFKFWIYFVKQFHYQSIVIIEIQTKEETENVNNFSFIFIFLRFIWKEKGFLKEEIGMLLHGQGQCQVNAIWNVVNYIKFCLRHLAGIVW